MRELLAPYEARYFISGEINSEVSDGAGQDGRDRAEATPTRRSPTSTAYRSTTTTGTSTCAPPTPSRCCASRSSRSSRTRTWSAAGTRFLASSAPDAGVVTIPLPTGFAVGPMNSYLIEDDPLTLIDAGPNSGTALDTLERGLAGARAPPGGPRADRPDPSAHGPHRADPARRRPRRRRGAGVRAAAAAAARLRRVQRGRHRVLHRAHGPPRRARGRAQGPAAAVARDPRVRRRRRHHHRPGRRRHARLRGALAADPPPPRPLAVRPRLPRRRSRTADRRRPPHQAHLLQRRGQSRPGRLRRSGAARWSTTWPRCRPRARWTSRGCWPATASRSPTTAR